MLAMNRSLRYKTMKEIISNHIKAYIQKLIRESAYQKDQKYKETSYRKKQFGRYESCNAKKGLKIKFADLLENDPRKSLGIIERKDRADKESVINILQI